MKKLVIFLAFITGCGQNTHLTTESKPNGVKPLYTVYKLDSINNYYLIYATKKDSTYKIISHKEYTSNCVKIKKGLSYEFKIRSMRENAPTIGGIKMAPINYNDIKCFQFDENTTICKEDGIYDLYFSKNIKGLCFIGDN